MYQHYEKGKLQWVKLITEQDIPVCLIKCSVNIYGIKKISFKLFLGPIMDTSSNEVVLPPSEAVHLLYDT